MQGFTDLKQGHKDWEEMLLEQLYCEWMTPEGVIKSAEQVFVKFQPMLTRAAREAKAAAAEGEDYMCDVPTYLEAIQARVSLDTREKKGSKQQRKLLGRRAQPRVLAGAGGRIAGETATCPGASSPGQSSLGGSAQCARTSRG